MLKLTVLKNIGQELERKLNAVGISTVEELQKIGSKAAFAKLKKQFPNVCLVYLYSLEGAIKNINYNALTEETKKELKVFSDKLK